MTQATTPTLEWATPPASGPTTRDSDSGVSDSSDSYDLVGDSSDSHDLVGDSRLLWASPNSGATPPTSSIRWATPDSHEPRASLDSQLPWAGDRITSRQVTPDSHESASNSRKPLVCEQLPNSSKGDILLSLWTRRLSGDPSLSPTGTLRLRLGPLLSRSRSMRMCDSWDVSPIFSPLYGVSPLTLDCRNFESKGDFGSKGPRG